MALKLKIKTLDEIPEATRTLYREAEDKDGFVLDVEGAVPKGQLEEFRSANLKLRKDKEAFRDVDPEEMDAGFSCDSIVPSAEYLNLSPASDSAAQRFWGH
jgi:hypothetical protein